MYLHWHRCGCGNGHRGQKVVIIDVDNQIEQIFERNGLLSLRLLVQMFETLDALLRSTVLTVEKDVEAARQQLYLLVYGDKNCIFPVKTNSVF